MNQLLAYFLVIILAAGFCMQTANGQPQKGVGASLPGALTPENDQMKARFDAVLGAAHRAGYADAVVVGAESKPSAAVFVLAATRAGKSQLLAMIEPVGAKSEKPAVIEGELLPGDMIRSVRFEKFLDLPGLMDVLVSHEPHQLESSYRFDTHYLLKRNGPAVTAAGQFVGNSSSEHAKGVMSISATRVVTPEKISDTAFVVHIVETQTVSTGGPKSDGQRTESAERYEMNSAGVFVLKK